MNDFNVTVQDVPIQINSCISNVIDITVAENGIQGAIGPSGADGLPGTGIVSFSGYITTGYADLRYYPLSGNPSGYLSSFNSGQYLTGFNSGQYLTGFNSGQYYLFSNPNHYSTSGDLQNTGIALFNLFSGFTGQSINTGLFLYTGNLIKYSVFATSGIETESINYPVSFSSKPISINCEFENDRDNLLYLHSLSGIGLTNFWINYSDFLSNTGYKINITINR